MTGFARAFVMGNLVRDPAMRYTPQGKPVCVFSVACNRKFRKAGEEQAQERTSFLEVEAFGVQAETCQKFLHKGDLVVVDGDIRQARFEGKDGQRRNIIRIAAMRVHFLPRRNGGGPPDEDRAGGAEEEEKAEGKAMEEGGGAETPEMTEPPRRRRKQAA